MKKVGLLLLALVIALGALGVGYARWSDSVSVAGTVNMATVKIGIADRGTIDDEITDSFGEEDTTGSDPQFYANGIGGINNAGKDVAYHGSVDGPCVITECDKSYAEYVTETISNAYPWYAGKTMLALANGGSVPVKIDGVSLTNIVDQKGLLAFMVVDAWTLNYHDEAGQAHEVTGTGFDSLGRIDNLQIPVDRCATLAIAFHFIEDANIDADSDLEVMPQNASLSFDVVVTASQWNEVGGDGTP